MIRRQLAAVTISLVCFSVGRRSQPCAASAVVLSGTGSLRRNHACDENSVGRADLLAGIEKQAGPRGACPMRQ